MSQPSLHSISPFFIVRDTAHSIAFYCDRLEFETRFQQPDQDPFFAIVARDAVQLLLKSEAGIEPRPNATRHPHLRWDAYIHTPDPDTLAADFTTRGVTFSAPLVDTDDGLRGFEVTDTDGYVLFFGHP